MIVVFDDHCNVCNFYVRCLKRHDRDRLSFLPASSLRGREILLACDESPDDPATMIVIGPAGPLKRSDAVLAAIAELGGAWRMVRLFAYLPRGIRDTLYTGLAKHRYRWFGRTDLCTACEERVR
ncbi:thiol-disulfide oxidoreductase DCC family protein [Sphingomonas faeni]|uniref:thiol-disulfide oxidoreductase DCC family protein n=1 Tax=Sphingomonas faeni TaxID=185950 RepID=UPI00334BD51C